MKNKILVITLILFIFTIVLVGVSLAFFTYSKNGDSNSKIITGDIYMHYKENNSLVLENAMPSNSYNSEKYFEFTIEGVNTNKQKDIWYEIVLNHGEIVASKNEINRIRDNLLKFTVTKQIDNGTIETIIDGASYNSLTNKRIWVDKINKNTNNNTIHKYKVYVWIDNNTVIGNTNEADYSINDWNNTFASIKVNVFGDFNKKYLDNNLENTINAIPNNFTFKVYNDNFSYLNVYETFMISQYVENLNINPTRCLYKTVNNIIQEVDCGSNYGYVIENVNDSTVTLHLYNQNKEEASKNITIQSLKTGNENDYNTIHQIDVSEFQDTYFHKYLNKNIIANPNYGGTNYYTNKKIIEEKNNEYNDLTIYYEGRIGEGAPDITVTSSGNLYFIKDDILYDLKYIGYHEFPIHYSITISQNEYNNISNYINNIASDFANLIEINNYEIISHDYSEERGINNRDFYYIVFKDIDNDVLWHINIFSE